MEHKILKLFKDGVWQGNPDRTVTINGEKHDLDEWAKAHGIDLPDAKKTKKQVNSYADMGQTSDEGSDKESGIGTSESTE